MPIYFDLEEDALVLKECAIITFTDQEGSRKILTPDIGGQTWKKVIMLDCKVVEITPQDLESIGRARFYRHLYKRIRKAMTDIFFSFYVRYGQR